MHHSLSTSPLLLLLSSAVMRPQREAFSLADCHQMGFLREEKESLVYRSQASSLDPFLKNHPERLGTLLPTRVSA